MTFSANESLHCTDYEMVCDRNFFAVLPQTETPKFELWRHSKKTLTTNCMKLSANESLRCNDYEMVGYVTEIFLAALPPAEAFEV